MPKAPVAWPVTLLLAGCATQTPLSSLPSPPWPHEPEPSQARAPAERTAPPVAWWNEVVPRSRWAKGKPLTTHMNRMVPVRAITVHHDGMDSFHATDARSAAERLEHIRQLHRNRGWADIGYHFAVDPAGRIWEARPIGYQGAHVKDHNPGNIGVVALGNFDRQSPSEAQLAGVARCVELLSEAYGIPRSNVLSHREWPGAATACPGGTLQHHLARVRN